MLLWNMICWKNFFFFNGKTDIVALSYLYVKTYIVYHTAIGRQLPSRVERWAEQDIEGRNRLMFFSGIVDGRGGGSKRNDYKNGSVFYQLHKNAGILLVERESLPPWRPRLSDRWGALTGSILAALLSHDLLPQVIYSTDHNQSTPIHLSCVLQPSSDTVQSKRDK